MFQASSAQFQEDTVVYMQHMVLSHFLVACRYTLKLCTDRPPGTLIESDSTIYYTCTAVSS